MTKAIFMLFGLLAPALQDGRDAKPIIDNNRVTVREITAGSGQLGSRDHDVVAIDLDAKTAAYISKGSTKASPKHAIVVDLKDATVAPVENKTPYPLAFPRPGVKKLVDNNRVFVWDYTWMPSQPTPMHFHDKDVVVVYLADGQLKSTTPDGKSEVNTISFGLTKFNAPNRSHTEELIKGSAHAIMVELK